MSAIAGVYRLNGKAVGREDLERVSGVLFHRGPDEAGIWNIGSVGLVHRMLRTTPESAYEKLPLSSADGKCVLTAEARIDNREELIGLLALHPRLGPFVTDGEIILAAYGRWGENCPKRFLGDFSFAIWDARRRVLFCARDAFGAKPFYYYWSEELFAFASEIKGILAFGGVPRRLNELAVADHLLWSSEDCQITFYKGIHRLPAAHTLTVSSDKASRSVYWSLNPTYELRLKSDGEYAERFRTIFGSAVRARLRSTGPVGSLLSGGLDSSSIVCTALSQAQGPAPLQTFSAVFNDVPECDETDYIRSIISLDGLESHLVRADKISPFHEIEKIFWHLDEPHSCNLAMFWGGFYPEAKAGGVRVLLDGDGGDEVVSRGYPYLAELFGGLRWIEWYKTARPLSHNTGKTLRYLLWQISLRPFVPAWIHGVWRRLRWGGRALWFDDTLLNPDFVKRMNVKERAAAQLGYEMKPARTARQDDFDTLSAGPIQYTLEVINRVSSAFSIEHRYPFFDKRLVEYCLSLPSEQKLYRGWTKMVMRRAMQGILPDKVRWRGGKTYLDQNIAHGLQTYERQILEEVLVKDTARIEPYVDMKGLADAYRSFLSKPTHASTTLVWQIAMFSLWLKEAKLEP